MSVPRPGSAADRRSADAGSSSTVGALFLVATALVLSGAVGLAVLDTGALAPSPPQALFDFEFTGNGTADVLVVEHETGDAIEGDRLTVVVSGAVPESANGGYRWSGATLGGDPDVESGSTVRLSASTIGDGANLDLDAATVRVVWNGSGDASVTLAEWSGPDSDGDASADAISRVAGSPAANGKQLVFDVTSTEPATVERFAVETAGNLSSVSRIDAADELRITGGGPPGRADAPSGYPTDGTAFALNDTGTVDPPPDSTVRVSGFPDAIDVYGFTDAESADVSVRLVFSDGSARTFHFAVDGG